MSGNQVTEVSVLNSSKPWRHWPPEDCRECYRTNASLPHFSTSKLHLDHLCSEYTKGSSFTHTALKLLGGEAKAAAQDPFPSRCALAKEVCTEARVLLPCLSCACPLWLRFCYMDEGNAPQGLHSPPRYQHLPQPRGSHTHQLLLQKLPAFLGRAESNHCSDFGNRTEQTAPLRDVA